MRPSSNLGRAVRIAAAAVAGVVLPAAIALAQPPPPTPVLARAPARVASRSDVTASGHLVHGAPGDEVLLQRRTPARAWRTVQTKKTDAQGGVRFRIEDVTRSVRLRLAWREGSEIDTASATVIIGVRPRLTLNRAPKHPLRGERIRVRGRLLPITAGRRIVLQRRLNGAWRTFARPRVKDGRYSGGFRARRLGNGRVRAVFRGDRANVPARRRARYRVYRRSLATWYGPGLIGNRTACGRRLTTRTLGVAHRRLPCGTEVSILYRGRTITVRVIDRGPYSRADWDLTQATARRLHFSGTARVGTTR